MSIFSSLSRLGAQKAAQEAIANFDRKIKDIEDSGVLKFKKDFSESESKFIRYLCNCTNRKKYKVYDSIPHDDSEKRILFQLIMLCKNPQTLDILSKDTIISVSGAISTVMGQNPTAGDCFILGANAIYCFDRLRPRTLPILLQDFNGFEVRKGMIYTAETKHEKDSDNTFFYPSFGKQSSEQLQEMVLMLNNIYGK